MRCFFQQTLKLIFFFLCLTMTRAEAAAPESTIFLQTVAVQSQSDIERELATQRALQKLLMQFKLANPDIQRSDENQLLQHATDFVVQYDYREQIKAIAPYVLNIRFSEAAIRDALHAQKMNSENADLSLSPKNNRIQLSVEKIETLEQLQALIQLVQQQPGVVQVRLTQYANQTGWLECEVNLKFQQFVDQLKPNSHWQWIGKNADKKIIFYRWVKI